MVESICSFEKNVRLMPLPLVDPNSNVTAAPDESMTISECCTFDTTEKIVYRRKVHKASSASKTPKKRVSFHEDILKNTRTDNIHIEHGFITYKNGRKLAFANSAGVAGAPGRYSWCPDRERPEGPNELSAAGREDDGEEATGGGGARRKRHLVYRNACSDVLDYDNIFDTDEAPGLHYDTSGVFEYGPATQKQEEQPQLYKCVCSSSNSSLDSDEQDKNSNANRKQYEQAKSSSCDCIGMSNANNNLIGDNCYYSEPNIGDADSPKVKSVWNKEKKPKSSCLKKTKLHTNVILEQDLNGRMKKFNVHDIKHQLLDNSSKMIFGSLKSIFTMPLPERGVPEGSEDLQAVVECVPELEQTPEHKSRPLAESPPLKAKPFLSKSLDGSKQAQQVKKFVHNVDEQLRHKNEDDGASSTEASPMESKQSLMLHRQEKFDKETVPMGSAQGEFRSKFIINCESTVFEHTGVSYETGDLQSELSSGIQHTSVASLLEQNTPIAEPAASQIKKSFLDAPIAKTFSNFFRSFKDSTSTAATPVAKDEQAVTDSYFASKIAKPQQQAPAAGKLQRNFFSSTISVSSSNTNTSSNHQIAMNPQLGNAEQENNETSIRKNNFFADKLRTEQRHAGSDLYVKGARPKNYELIDDLNAEIAMEIEMCGTNSPRRELAISLDNDFQGNLSNFELGIGEISIDVFNGKSLLNLKQSNEQLMKAFKLYTGYSVDGIMTPVLVLLTDKTLYVVNMDRNSLCVKFVLAYKDLDVILMGPFGNTVLLSNSNRDMQQVLLAGGPYPAGSLVANLELCARRSGSTLPAVGQLTLEHLAPLQAFVRANSCVGGAEHWMFYAVVNVPAGGSMRVESPSELLGPSMKGFLMHRRLRQTISTSAANRIFWQPGYFLLKAGVLYMFNDSTQRLPSWAMALAECQGARRTVKSERPHCFEITLKGEVLQMAAPDEYVASEWLQALLQSASGLLVQEEKHKTLGCTLIVTENHLITLREDFSAPLRKISQQADNNAAVQENKESLLEEDVLSVFETSSLMGSTISTPTRGTQHSYSSLSSTPTKQTNEAAAPKEIVASPEKSQRMTSVYGKNSGLAILTCADIKEMTGIKITSRSETWWCILEFSCQEAPLENQDDLVIFFASSMEMQRFLRLLEQLWQSKNNDLFPITILDDGDSLAEQYNKLYMDTNRAWEPLLSAALG
ncbi:GD20635 [Drosophila simulans]|uniref:GD20635 n=1 Tax=Drosophila simulans TaxID=7240 RepID=B4QTL2_DROSI|nr:GD20635 [Drosophila simulans]